MGWEREAAGWGRPGRGRARRRRRLARPTFRVPVLCLRVDDGDVVLHARPRRAVDARLQARQRGVAARCV